MIHSWKITRKMPLTPRFKCTLFNRSFGSFADGETALLFSRLTAAGDSGTENMRRVHDRLPGVALTVMRHGVGIIG